MGLQDCRHCGKQVEEGETYCARCRIAWGSRKPGRLWVFSLLFSAVLLLLAGLLLWHGGFSLPGFFPADPGNKTAAVVNGESIFLAEFEGRFQRVQTMLERQHCGQAFSGERGKGTLEELKGELLEAMVEEKLIDQEARRLGIRVSEERVQQEMERVVREVFGSADDFRDRLKTSGTPKKDLQNQLRNILLVEAIKKAKASKEMDAEDSFVAWLSRARQNARIEISDSIGRRDSAWAASCCIPNSNGRGCQAPSQSRGGSASRKEEEAKQAAMEEFQRSNPDQKEITARVIDYGCHFRVEIEKEGETLTSYTYQNGKVRKNP